MQEVLLATEKFEQECMEAAECEQREARPTETIRSSFLREAASVKGCRPDSA